MSIRDDLMDLLEALDGNDYADIADLILTRYGVVELPDQQLSNLRIEADDHYQRITVARSDSPQHTIGAAQYQNAESARALAAALLAAVNRVEEKA